MHENTLQFAREVGFQRTHVFRYSPRPRTLAETLVDNVTDDEKKRRHAELQAIVNETDRAFTARYVGERSRFWSKGAMGENGTVSGHTPNYINVTFPAPRALPCWGRSFPSA